MPRPPTGRRLEPPGLERTASVLSPDRWSIRFQATAVELAAEPLARMNPANRTAESAGAAASQQ
jgi:hypothetical protein